LRNDMIVIEEVREKFEGSYCLS